MCVSKFSMRENLQNHKENMKYGCEIIDRLDTYLRGVIINGMELVCLLSYIFKLC